MTPSCRLDQLSNFEINFLTPEEVQRLRNNTSLYTDKALIHFANTALWSTICIASTYNKKDRTFDDNRKRFLQALQELKNTISSISDPGFRNSVCLPTTYTNSLKHNYFLNYSVQPNNGAPPKARESSFYFRLLALYQAFTGKPPKSTVGGPTTKFMRKIVEILEKHLNHAEAHTELYDDVRRLWRLPGDDAIHKWFGDSENKYVIETKVNAYVHELVETFERETGLRASV